MRTKLGELTEFQRAGESKRYLGLQGAGIWSYSCFPVEIKPSWVWERLKNVESVAAGISGESSMQIGVSWGNKSKLGGLKGQDAECCTCGRPGMIVVKEWEEVVWRHIDTSALLVPCRQLPRTLLTVSLRCTLTTSQVGGVVTIPFHLMWKRLGLWCV